MITETKILLNYNLDRVNELLTLARWCEIVKLCNCLIGMIKLSPCIIRVISSQVLLSSSIKFNKTQIESFKELHSMLLIDDKKKYEIKSYSNKFDHLPWVYTKWLSITIDYIHSLDALHSAASILPTKNCLHIVCGVLKGRQVK